MHSIFQTRHLNKVGKYYVPKDSNLRRYNNRYKRDATCYCHLNSLMTKKGAC